ncbi:archaeal proteasome endopeptidase complex subunit alpha [Candidatus Woesearchaeota archaeon]|nr:archaeal proteasome endopeptidase complex subunit alpha [Candidatus Woesearchaeota archaeon]
MQPNSMMHQQMGYDRAITMFSPDGRLLQVEYAKKTVKQGSTSIGIVCKDGVMLIADKRVVDPLIIPESVEKVWEIDEHIATTAAGIISDARVLVERAQLAAQQNRLTYDSPIDTASIVKELCALKQITTQSGGLRPFGVSMLIGGVDKDGPKLYSTDPTGIYFQYKATVIGEGETDILEELHKKYKDDMTINEAVKLSVDLLKKFLDKDFSADRLDIVYIKKDEKKFTRMKADEIKKLK